MLNHLNKTFGNSITANNASKNVDKDTCDLWITGDELKSLLDCSWSSTATNIEEIGWITTINLNDIHSCHCKPSSINQTSNITIKFDEIEVGFCRLDFISVFLSGITP